MMISTELVLMAIIQGVLVGGTYGLLAMGANMIVGIMRIINLAQGAFAMLGMFVAYWFFTLYNVSPFVSLPVAFVMLFIGGALVAKFIFSRTYELPHSYTVILTYGMLTFIVNVAQYFWTGDFRRLEVQYGSFKLGPITISAGYLLAFITATIIAFVLFTFLSKSKLGKAIRAVSQDAEASTCLGINVEKIRMITAGIGLGLAGLAGVIFALVYYIYPYVGGTFSTMAVIICVFGGLGDYRGAYFAALIIGLAQSVSILFIPFGLKDAVAFAIFILTLIFKPQGLFGRRLT
jgi:branched-chain amino acid transport system permease protein